MTGTIPADWAPAIFFGTVLACIAIIGVAVLVRAFRTPTHRRWETCAECCGDRIVWAPGPIMCPTCAGEGGAWSDKP